MIQENRLIYQNKDWLYEEYVVKEKTANAIGGMAGVLGGAISYWLRKHEISIRGNYSEERKRKILNSRKRTNNPGWKGGLKELVCKNCVTVFTAPKCRLTRKYCSPKCIDRSGEKNSRWNGGRSFEPYPIAFNNKLRERIRNYDDRVCQLCNKSEIENGRRLTVHHIDSDKTNCNIDNLIAICLSCNSKSDTVEKEFLCRTIVLNRRLKNMIKNFGGDEE